MTTRTIKWAAAGGAVLTLAAATPALAHRGDGGGHRAQGPAILASSGLSNVDVVASAV